MAVEKKPDPEAPVDEEKIARIAKNIFAMPPEPRKEKRAAAKATTRRKSGQKVDDSR